jgi:hypothetical protein
MREAISSAESELAAAAPPTMAKLAVIGPLPGAERVTEKIVLIVPA